MTPDLGSQFAGDGAVVGNWVSFPEPAVAELFTSMDFDFIGLDMEHSTMGLADI